jgi:hypothetical protein
MLPEAVPSFAPGQRWKPTCGPASMSRIIKRITPSGVVFDESWPSQRQDSFDQWVSWADWLMRTGARLQANEASNV